MSYIDLHCDSLLSAEILNEKDIYENPKGMLDVKRLHEAKVMAQFFAIFFPPYDDELMLKRKTDQAYFDSLYQIYQNTIDQYPDIIRPAGNEAEILQNCKDGCVSSLLTLEDGRIIQGEMDNLQKVYDKGVRLITLTWNFENCFGFPNSSDETKMKKGLKPFGIEAIEEMNRLGVIVDVSHLSDGGFYDVAKTSKKPFVASHSNARSLSPHQRNMTDDMIRTLADKGGIAGLNFAGYFLNQDLSDHKSRVEAMAKHILYMANIGGEDLVAIGTDFDGFEGECEISEPSKMELLVAKLQQNGMTGRQMDKWLSGNALRVIREVL